MIRFVFTNIETDIMNFKMDYIKYNLTNIFEYCCQSLKASLSA